jgi:hypothetical protein
VPSRAGKEGPPPEASQILLLQLPEPPGSEARTDVRVRKTDKKLQEEEEDDETKKKKRNKNKKEEVTTRISAHHHRSIKWLLRVRYPAIVAMAPVTCRPWGGPSREWRHKGGPWLRGSRPSGGRSGSSKWGMGGTRPKVRTGLTMTAEMLVHTDQKTVKMLTSFVCCRPRLGRLPAALRALPPPPPQVPGASRCHGA